MSKNDYRIKRFISEYAALNLEDDFQLPNTEYQNIKIRFKIDTLRLLYFSIHYTKNYYCPNLDLPPELVRHIKGYLPDMIQIELSVSIPSDYPFKPHIWEFLKVKSNMKLNEEKYYDIIKTHNCYNIGDWSPAMSLDKDILSLIEKYYDYLYY